MLSFLLQIALFSISVVPCLRLISILFFVIFFFFLLFLVLNLWRARSPLEDEGGALGGKAEHDQRHDARPGAAHAPDEVSLVNVEPHRAHLRRRHLHVPEDKGEGGVRHVFVTLETCT